MKTIRVLIVTVNYLLTFLDCIPKYIMFFLYKSVKCRTLFFQSGQTAKSAAPTCLLKQTCILFLLVQIFDNGHEAFTVTPFWTDYVGFVD